MIKCTVRAFLICQIKYKYNVYKFYANWQTRKNILLYIFFPQRVVVEIALSTVGENKFSFFFFILYTLYKKRICANII